VALRESLFDADFPGHYMRRLKSVALTLPCVVGPYTSVNCILTLVRHSIRLSSNPLPKYEPNAAVVASLGAIESIVTSSAQRDCGTFELNFRDERYLPFEGAGAISLWKVELPRDTNRFDIAKLADVVFHVSYTARDGGEPLRAAARASIGLAPSPPPPPTPATIMAQPAMRLFSARRDFSDAFYRFLHPDPAANQTLDLDLSDARFAYHGASQTISLTKIRVILLTTPDIEASDVAKLTAILTDPNGSAQPATATGRAFSIDPTLAQLSAVAFSGGPLAVSSTPGTPTGWNLRILDDALPPSLAMTMDGRSRLNPDKVQDVGVLCEYSLS
jgi:hypothetical protein